jgi:four helix bundle protein
LKFSVLRFAFPLFFVLPANKVQFSASNVVMTFRPLDDRLLHFAADVLRLLMDKPDILARAKNADQLARSATSVGAESKADFIHKMQVALKEARETCYWLRLAALLHPTFERLPPLVQESLEIRAMLVAAVNRAKANAQDEFGR